MEVGNLTREQAAKYLCVSLPVLDAFLHRTERPIPSIKAGRKYLIPRTLLDQWLRDETKRSEIDE